MNGASQQAETKQTAEKAVLEKKMDNFRAETHGLRMMMSLNLSSAAEMIRADRDAR
jgi:hypothetical protein